MSKQGKHHFAPVFYLTQWVGDDGCLSEYKRRYRGVLPKRVVPDATGYAHGLYSVPGLPPGQEQYVERKFMASVDSRASLALSEMLDESRAAEDFPLRYKVAWAQFVYSLTFRAPNVIARLQNTMDQQIASGALRQPEIPFRPAEVFPSMLTSKTVIKALLSMHWKTSCLDKAKHRLLTCDRPIIMTNGLERPDAHVVLPISPRTFFLAYRSDDFFSRVAGLSQEALASTINDAVVRQAIDFVYAYDGNQTRFIQNRFGERLRSTPLD